MTSPDMTWQDAIIKVLEDAEEPLGYNEITRLIDEQELRSLSGATPANTVNSNLTSLTDEGKVERIERGLYALPQKAEQYRTDVEKEEKEVASATADPGKLTVKACGLYWERNLVDWTKKELWGQQSLGSRPVEFSGQVGIYLLHWGNEITYVGQTQEQTHKSKSAGLYNRLQEHHKDAHKSDRWDTFSWFGFKPVTENGELLPAPEGGNLGDVINVIEAMFIESIMPRLNMRRGENTKATGMYNQVALQTAGRIFR